MPRKKKPVIAEPPVAPRPTIAELMHPGPHAPINPAIVTDLAWRVATLSETLCGEDGVLVQVMAAQAEALNTLRTLTNAVAALHEDVHKLKDSDVQQNAKLTLLKQPRRKRAAATG